MAYIIGFVVGWFAIAFLREWCEQTRNDKVADIVEKVLYFPYCATEFVLTTLLCILYFPFLLIYHLFRNVAKPVSPENWEKNKPDYFWGKGNFKMCYDREAKKLVKKIFFVYIDNNPNKPSVPKGEFRFESKTDESQPESENNEAEKP